MNLLEVAFNGHKSDDYEAGKPLHAARRAKTPLARMREHAALEQAIREADRPHRASRERRAYPESGSVLPGPERRALWLPVRAVGGAMSDQPTIQVPRGCPNAPSGCCCTGACQELIDVVPADEYWRVVGERDEARRTATSQTCRAPNGTCVFDARVKGIVSLLAAQYRWGAWRARRLLADEMIAEHKRVRQLTARQRRAIARAAAG